ncbi:unnamed protein product [Diatraea saccharalis]|uniref:Uncharacterized protein n=1 Tax=Diatraea saccharalis TaxID=40085 RepID=A0A9N9RBX7_9NEOP|nr:unnamed protein product [Diatraea saccharalis]
MANCGGGWLRGAGRMGAGRMGAWRAHAYGGRAELRLEAARVPPLRAPDHVLVRVRAASLNPLDVAMLGIGVESGVSGGYSVEVFVERVRRSRAEHSPQVGGRRGRRGRRVPAGARARLRGRGGEGGARGPRGAARARVGRGAAAPARRARALRPRQGSLGETRDATDDGRVNKTKKRLPDLFRSVSRAIAGLKLRLLPDAISFKRRPTDKK